MPRVKKDKEQTEIKKDLKIDIYNLSGKVAGKADLPGEFFAAKISMPLVTQAIRVYTANQRAGTHDTKTRTFVIGSTKKIYRQKGTGRARHGDIKAPIFVGGGVAHGPKPKDYSLSLPKKMRQKVFCASLTDKFRNGKLKVVTGLAEIEPKTKNVNLMLKNLGYLTDDGTLGRSIVLVLPSVMRNVILAGRNIENLSISQVENLSAYDILRVQEVLFMKESLKVLDDRSASKVKEDKKEKKASEMDLSLETGKSQEKKPKAVRAKKAKKEEKPAKKTVKKAAKKITGKSAKKK